MDGSISDDSPRAKEELETPKKKNWNKYFARCDEDEVIEDTLKVIQEIQKNHPEVTIVVTTGRPVWTQHKTRNWLINIGLRASKYFMRKGFEKNHILKENNLKKAWKEGFYCVLAIDDNQKAIDMYKEKNVPNLLVVEHE